jgi:hypothetical protein
MRPWVEKTYGIPPEQVVGSSAVTRFEMRPTGPVILKEPNPASPSASTASSDAGRSWPSATWSSSTTDSDGDQQMLQWTAAGGGRRFIGIVHHTDGEREWAYDRQSQVGKLDKALDEALTKGWTIVDMRKDWKRIYPFER